MFKNLQNTIKELNADVNNVANCEKAKKLRKKLISFGLPMAIVGFVGLFVCVILFATAGFDAVTETAFSAFDGVIENAFSARILVPFFMAVPCAVLGSIGAKLASLGFKIVVTGYTTNLIKETVGNNCPKCGEAVEMEMKFCPKCGEGLKKECANCKHINNHKNDFCEKCGNKLD